jgi:hypothetical protein
MKNWFSQLGTTRQTLLIAGGVLAVIIAIGASSGGDSNSQSTSAAAADTSPATTNADVAQTATTSTKAKPTKPTKPKGDAAVNRNTRRYVSAVNACRLSAAIVRSAAAKGDTDLVDMADLTTTARDTCDGARSTLPTLDTDHFDDQAAQAWGGVDEIKSGLNAVLAYIDDPRPSKIIEARNKLDDGESTAADGLRQINERRKVYGLKTLKAAR